MVNTEQISERFTDVTRRLFSERLLWERVQSTVRETISKGMFRKGTIMERFSNVKTGTLAPGTSARTFHQTFFVAWVAASIHAVSCPEFCNTEWIATAPRIDVQ
jgi:hypothetical protein